MKKLGSQIIFYSALIGIWALLAKLHVWPPYLFPPPWGVGEALWQWRDRGADPRAGDFCSRAVALTHALRQ